MNGTNYINIYTIYDDNNVYVVKIRDAKGSAGQRGGRGWKKPGGRETLLESSPDITPYKE